MSNRIEIGDWCTLYHADSVELIETLREHAPDAVIMDPPYGIGLSVDGTTTAAGGSIYDKSRKKKKTWPKIAGDHTGASIGQWINFADQTLLWGADHLRSQLPSYGRFLVWDKLAGLDTFGDFGDAELAWHSKGKASRIVQHRWKGLVAWCAGGDDARHVRLHPMQKPIRVMEWCIDQCRLEPDALILDPYMGSGTTAIAAFKRRMRFVGVEIDRRWFDVAVERIKRMTADGPLFEAPPEQTAMAV